MARWNSHIISSLLAGALAAAAIAGCGGGGSGGTDGAGGAGGAGGSTDAGGETATDGGSETAPVELTLTILHTNDLHSHLMGYAPEADYTPATTGDNDTIGGFARIATAIKTEKTKLAGKNVLLLDAGDFMMGTAFHLISTKAAAELTLMKAIGYDAITLGNHEFDWSPRGLAAILEAATKGGFDVPILASNTKFDPISPADDDLQAFETKGVLRRKLVRTLDNGLRVGLFGLMGKDAADVSPLAKPVVFEDEAKVAKALVAELRDVDKVDVVIAISHSGVNADGTGEDEALAKSVPGIDVIVSGHTHDVLEAPAKVGSTLIVTAGAYAQYVGRLDLKVTRTGGVVKSVAQTAYELTPIDDKIAGDAATQAAIDTMIAGLDGTLGPLGYAYRKDVLETGFDITNVNFEETLIGNIVADGYRAVTSALQPGEPPDIALEASGLIRVGVNKGKTGKAWFADLYRVLPMGIGPDGVPGYPLVTYYMNGKDLKAGLELSVAADALKNSSYFFQVSGMRAEYDGSKPPFGRVTALSLGNPGGTTVPIDGTDTTKCYKVVTNLFVATLVGLTGSLTGGLLSVDPKEKDCTTTITDWSTHLVDADPMAAGTQELKIFNALLGYVAQFPDTNGNMIPDVPAAYATRQGRIVKK